MPQYDVMRALSQASIRYRKIDPELFQIVRDLVEAYENGDFVEADPLELGAAPSALRTYALAEQRCHDATYVNYVTVAREWGLEVNGPEHATRQITVALKLLRDQAVSEAAMPYTATDVKDQLSRIARIKEDKAVRRAAAQSPD